MRSYGAIDRSADVRSSATTDVVAAAPPRKVHGRRTVVDGVSFTVDEGEIFGILGPNGAGKTTTVECVEGLRVPDAGRVRVTGLDPVTDHDRVTRVLGAQPQEGRPQEKLTVREALELYAALCPHPRGPRQRAPLRPRQAGRQRPRRGGRGGVRAGDPGLTRRRDTV